MEMHLTCCFVRAPKGSMGGKSSKAAGKHAAKDGTAGKQETAVQQDAAAKQEIAATQESKQLNTEELEVSRLISKAARKR